MNGTDLSKSQKKIARQIIEKGLQKEFMDGIIELDNIITKWKINELDNRNAYHELYDSLTKHDKHIAGRYDNMGGSKYLYVIAGQLFDGAITKNDLDDFNEDVRESILFLSGVDS